MNRKWAVLALVALGTFMTTLDASIVDIGLPSIARSFQETSLTGFRGALTISAAIAAVGVFAALVRGDERTHRNPSLSATVKTREGDPHGRVPA